MQERARVHMQVLATHLEWSFFGCTEAEGRELVGGHGPDCARLDRLEAKRKSAAATAATAISHDARAEDRVPRERNSRAQSPRTYL